MTCPLTQRWRDLKLFGVRFGTESAEDCRNVNFLALGRFRNEAERAEIEGPHHPVAVVVAGKHDDRRGWVALTQLGEMADPSFDRNRFVSPLVAQTLAGSQRIEPPPGKRPKARC